MSYSRSSYSHTPCFGKGGGVFPYVVLELNVTSAVRNIIEGIKDCPSTGNACAICFENEAIVALNPCGHTNFCYGCIKNIEICPICRKRIEGVLRIYK